MIWLRFFALMAYQTSRVIKCQSHPCGRKTVYIFCIGINWKLNLIVRRGFELVYFDVAVQHTSYYSMKIPPIIAWNYIIIDIRILEAIQLCVNDLF